MTDFLKSALGAIPDAATSPFALAGYIVAILAYVVVAWRVERNKNLLHHLQRLPKEDRFRALQVEMGSVFLREGISPEQWVQSRIHKYYLIAFMFVVGAIMAVFIILFVNLRSELQIVGVAPIEGVDNFNAMYDDPSGDRGQMLVRGVDIKLKNSGTDSAFVTAVRLLVYPGNSSSSPCGTAMAAQAVYEYSIDTLLGYLVSRNESGGKGASETHLVSIMGDRLPASSARKYPAYNDTYPIYVSNPIYVSQVTPAGGVDRFQVAFRSGPSQIVTILADPRCVPGARYPLRLILTYDTNKSLITQPLWIIINRSGMSAVTKP
jgi:hypothetical protein